MRYLLDTNALLWLLDTPSQIPLTTLAKLRSSDNELFVSTASIWEIAIKRSIGKLTITRPTQAIVDELPRLAIQLIPILPRHITRSETLPFHHRDPFDRLIIAQAITEDQILVSKDGNFPLYSAQVLWD